MVSLFANDMPRGCLPVAILPICQVGWNPEGHPSSYLYATCWTTCLCTPANTRQPYSNPCSSHVSTKSCESRDGQTCLVTKRASPQSWMRSRCSLKGLRASSPRRHRAATSVPRGCQMSGSPNVWTWKKHRRCRRQALQDLLTTTVCGCKKGISRHAGGQRKMGGEYYVDTI